MPALQVLADFIDAHRAEIVGLLRRRVALFAQGADAGLVEPWVQDQIDFFRGDASHTREWMAVLVDHVRSRGGHIGDVLAIIRSVRETLLGFVRDRIPGVSEAEMYRAFLDSEAHVLRHVGESCGEAERKRASSEQRCRQMLAGLMGRAFVMLDGDGVVTLTNAHFADLVGVPVDRLVGGGFLALCDAGTAGELRRDLRQKRGTRAHKFEGALCPRQDRIPAVFRVSPVFDEDGLRDGVAVAITPADSAEKRQGEGFLVRGVEELADALQIGFYVLDDSARVVLANETAGTFVAVGEEDSAPCYARREAQGNSDLHCDACMSEHALQAGEMRRDTIQFPTRAGEICWVEVACVPLPGEAGSRNRMAKLLRDVTAQKMVEEQLLRHQHTSLASQLAATVAHQLRNPLGVMLGLTEMMSKGMPADQVAGAVDRVLRNGLRCKEVLDNLLEFGRGTTDEFVS
ncbi:MAG: PAS domain-containing protein, partial [Nitrospiraceae bacterium]|nr:PAS domain-containing protein [Nitrospiraceae bacterium]